MYIELGRYQLSDINNGHWALKRFHTNHHKMALLYDFDLLMTQLATMPDSFMMNEDLVTREHLTSFNTVLYLEDFAVKFEHSDLVISAEAFHPSMSDSDLKNCLDTHRCIMMVKDVSITRLFSGILTNHIIADSFTITGWSMETI